MDSARESGTRRFRFREHLRCRSTLLQGLPKRVCPRCPHVLGGWARGHCCWSPFLWMLDSEAAQAGTSRRASEKWVFTALTPASSQGSSGLRDHCWMLVPDCYVGTVCAVTTQDNVGCFKWIFPSLEKQTVYTRCSYKIVLQEQIPPSKQRTGSLLPPRPQLPCPNSGSQGPPAPGTSASGQVGPDVGSRPRGLGCKWL